MPLAHPAAHLLTHICINKGRWVAAVHFVAQQQGDSSRTHLTFNRPQIRAHGGGDAPVSSSVPSPSPDAAAAPQVPIHRASCVLLHTSLLYFLVSARKMCAKTSQCTSTSFVCSFSLLA
ncbi:hypothetical protein VPH35_001558 [Triticum aestivum]